ncbi:Single-stranded DNA-binding protein [bacterium HR29]|jgi:single-strand DNA-binding protein|nr:Single-stranded DNA-binding protein [bacterium HR29]
MAGLNKVLLIGNTGRDMELRYTATGVAVGQFSLAVNSRRRSAAGDWEEATEWFNVVVFGDQAERLAQWITKGRQLFVEGRLQTRSWDDPDGNRRTRVEVVAQNVQLLGRPGDGDAGGRGAEEEPFEAASRNRRGGSPALADDFEATDLDDLPFE